MQTGEFSEESLNIYQTLLHSCAELLGDQAGVYDFARCIRPDGTAFGTRGKCLPPNKPAPTKAPEQPEPQTVKEVPAVKKVEVSMGGYKTNLNVSTKGLFSK